LTTQPSPGRLSRDGVEVLSINPAPGLLSRMGIEVLVPHVTAYEMWGAVHG
jgi:hypothetical protein